MKMINFVSKEVKELIVEWALERDLLKGINPSFMRLILEETNELFAATSVNERVDAICDQLVYAIQYEWMFNNMTKEVMPLGLGMTMDDMIRNVTDNCQDLLTLYEVDPDTAMTECWLEINSRKQDPLQKVKWANGVKRHNEKWEKWADQPVDQLYKADYTKAKIKGLGVDYE